MVMKFNSQVMAQIRRFSWQFKVLKYVNKELQAEQTISMRIHNMGWQAIMTKTLK